MYAGLPFHGSEASRPTAPLPTRQLGCELPHVHQVLRRPHSSHEARELEPTNFKQAVACAKARHQARSLESGARGEQR